MKRFIISVSILLIAVLGLMTVFAEAAVTPSRLVPEPNRPTMRAEAEPNKTTITKAEPNKTTTVPEPNTLADILADPNKIEAEIKSFKGLQKELDELNKKGAEEEHQWLQKEKEISSRISLTKDNHERIMDELMFIRKLAVEEGAKQTTAAIDGLLLNRQKQFDKLIEKLQEQRREERKELRQDRSTTRSRSTTDQRSSQDRRTRGR